MSTAPYGAPPSLNIIGAGKVGQTLGRLWHQAKVFSPGDVMTRSAAGAEAAVRFIGAGRPVSSFAELRPADVYLLTVPDREIANAAGTLAALAALPDRAVAVHCSGALGADELAALKARGWAVASAHPALSFADPARAVAQFAGCLCGLEGDTAALALIGDALDKAGARCFELDGQKKLLYHAGSVFASNFTTVLLDVALRAYRSSGLDESTARALLEPLVRNAIDNSLRLGPAAALTGPASRGETALVQRQGKTVGDWDEAAGVAYRQLSGMAASLASRRST